MSLPINFLIGFKKQLMTIKPGQETWVEAILIDGESGALRILENIPGAFTEFYWRTDLEYPTRIYFSRLENPLDDGWRTYVTPELEPFYELRENGFWKTKS